ncbi:hypothetical protein AgCh_018129 [Apium graveolens]
MGYSKKSVKMEGETEGRKWMLAALRSPLKPMHTNREDNKKECDEMHEQVECDEENCTTPTSDESRIPSSIILQCPGAPKKRKSSSSNKFQFVGRDFFSPPELETLFMQNHQKNRVS